MIIFDSTTMCSTDLIHLERNYMDKTLPLERITGMKTKTSDKGNQTVQLVLYLLSRGVNVGYLDSSKVLWSSNMSEEIEKVASLFPKDSEILTSSKEFFSRFGNLGCAITLIGEVFSDSYQGECYQNLADYHLNVIKRNFEKSEMKMMQQYAKKHD